MGYNLSIGEAYIEYDSDFVRVQAKFEKHSLAPAFGEPTDRTNERLPSYSSWSSAMCNLGLMDLMFDEYDGGSGGFKYEGQWIYPLIQSHSGCAPITKNHVKIVEQKLNEYKEKHPDHIAQYPPVKKGAKPLFGDVYREEDYVDDPKCDVNLCRGEWLLYWLKWAVVNCEKPVFVNS